MKKIKAVIEKANDGGSSIYSEDVDGAYGFGLTEQEAKDDFIFYSHCRDWQKLPHSLSAI